MTYFLALMTLAACGSDAVSSDQQAKQAYIALDGAIAKSLALGFTGFATASSANISPQMDTGDHAGTLAITGQVDQGSSSNKGMRLAVAMAGYDDGPVDVDGDTVQIAYTTAAATPPALDLDLKGIPTGTLTGTLTGAFAMSGDLDGTVVLDLTLAGALQSDGHGGTERAPGTTTVDGTATSGDGAYTVALTL